MPKRLIPLVFVIVLVVAACTGDGGNALTTSAGTPPASEDAATNSLDANPRGTDGESVLAAGQVGFGLPADLKIIREGHLSIRVEAGTFDAALSQLRLAAFDAGGYISDAATQVDAHGEDRYVTGSVTIRIPGDRFDDVLESVSGIGERLSLRVDSQDVTEEYVDLESRLRHWQAMERFHLQLLTDATTVPEALQVQNELSEVQLTIEQIQGRLRYLESRTSFATLTVNLTEAPDTVVATTTTPPGPLAKAWTDAVDVLMESLGFILIAGAGLIPFAALAALGWLLWRAVRPGRHALTEAAATGAVETTSEA